MVCIIYYISVAHVSLYVLLISENYRLIMLIRTCFTVRTKMLQCRFKGSTLEVIGLEVVQGEWIIVGGTGQFAMATGIIYKRLHEKKDAGDIVELAIEGFCPRLKGSRVRRMFGPYWAR